MAQNAFNMPVQQAAQPALAQLAQAVPANAQSSGWSEKLRLYRETQNGAAGGQIRPNQGLTSQGEPVAGNGSWADKLKAFKAQQQQGRNQIPEQGGTPAPRFPAPQIGSAGFEGREPPRMINLSKPLTPQANAPGARQLATDPYAGHAITPDTPLSKPAPLPKKYSQGGMGDPLAHASRKRGQRFIAQGSREQPRQGSHGRH